MQRRHNKGSIALEEDEEPRPTRCVTNRQLRKGGDDEVATCSLCLVPFKFREFIPSMVQCPACQSVYHERCFAKLISSIETDSFNCPMCRSPFTLDDYNGAWQPDALVETIEEDDDEDYSCDNPVPQAHVSDKPPEPPRRLLRSHNYRTLHPHTKQLRSGKVVVVPSVR